MAARAQRTLLCFSVAVLLVTPCCNAARSLSRTGTTGLLSSRSVLEDDPEVPRNDTDEGVPTSALEKDVEFHPWARFQAQEVTEDYNPPEANPDPGNPSPEIGD